MTITTFCLISSLFWAVVIAVILWRGKMEFATQLAELRKMKNLSYAKLSELSGLPVMTIFNYEHGVMPPLDKANQLLKALGVTIILGEVQSIEKVDDKLIIRRR